MTYRITFTGHPHTSTVPRLSVFLVTLPPDTTDATALRRVVDAITEVFALDEIETIEPALPVWGRV